MIRKIQFEIIIENDNAILGNTVEFISFYYLYSTHQTTQQIMIRPFSQGYISHVTHNYILRHIRWTIENDVFVTPSATFQRYLPGLVIQGEKIREFSNGRVT